MPHVEAKGEGKPRRTPMVWVVKEASLLRQKEEQFEGKTFVVSILREFGLLVGCARGAALQTVDMGV